MGEGGRKGGIDRARGCVRGRGVEAFGYLSLGKSYCQGNAACALSSEHNQKNCQQKERRLKPYPLILILPWAEQSLGLIPQQQ